MNLASDLMGLGTSPLQALRTSNGGNGPLTATAAGTNFATATRLQSSQYFVSVSGANGTNGVALPPVGSDTGALLADDFVINNLAAGQPLQIFASTGVTISAGGSNTAQTSLAAHTSGTFYPLSATQWIAVRGS